MLKSRTMKTGTKVEILRKIEVIYCANEAWGEKVYMNKRLSPCLRW